VNDFNGFGEGWEMASKAEMKDEIEDRIRFFAEDCDSLQGFVILSETFSGFGGIAASVLRDLADDYSVKLSVSNNFFSFLIKSHLLLDITRRELFNF
jgi:hypothetical protein